MPLADSNPFADLVPKADAAPHADNPFGDLIPQQPSAQDTGILAAPFAGVRQAVREMAQTGEALAGSKPEPLPAENTVAAQPMTWADLIHPITTTEKALYGLGHSFPSIGLGIGAGAAASAVVGGPETPLGAGVGAAVGLAAGALGAGAGSMMQEIGPRFAAALKETPQDADGAFDKAVKQAGISGALGGVGWAVFGFQPFASAFKNILFQALAVQPGVAAAGRAAENVVEGKPAGEGVAAEVPGAIVGTAVPLVGHAALHQIGTYLHGSPPLETRMPSSSDVAVVAPEPEMPSISAEPPREPLATAAPAIPPEVARLPAEATPQATAAATDALLAADIARQKEEAATPPLVPTEPPAPPTEAERPVAVPLPASVEPVPRPPEPPRTKAVAPEAVLAGQEGATTAEPRLVEHVEPAPQPTPAVVEAAAVAAGSVPVAEPDIYAKAQDYLRSADKPLTPGQLRFRANQWLGRPLDEAEFDALTGRLEQDGWLPQKGRGERYIQKPQQSPLPEAVPILPSSEPATTPTPVPVVTGPPESQNDISSAFATAERIPRAEDRQIALAGDIATRLETAAPLTSRELQQMADSRFGGSLAQNAYTRDQLYDALELGVNKYIQANPERFATWAPLDKAQDIARDLGALKESLPTQTVRAGEKDTLQQFSTPPDYAYAAAWVANLRMGDHVLEPSAGTGSLAVHAMNGAGAEPSEVTTNELSANRAPLVESLGPDHAFREDAEQLDNVLPQEIQPSVVLMNPPFSAAGTRMAGKTLIGTGAAHVEQALDRLDPGGRLVAILGRGMGIDMEGGRPREGTGAVFAPWWRQIGEQYDVRANVGVPGSVYGKYGTTFGTRLVVIDKVLPSGRPIVTGEARDIPDLMARLAEVRNDRPTAGIAGQPLAGQPGGAEVAPGGEGAAGPGSAVPPATAEPGVRAEPAAPRPGPAVPLGVEPGGGRTPEPAIRPAAPDAVVRDEPERAGGPGGADRIPDGGAPEREVVGAGGAAPDATVLRPEGGERSVLPTGRDASGVASELPEAAKVDEIAAQPETAGEITEQVFEPYRPQRISIEGAQEHPGKLVQSAAMASVMPPRTDYAPRLPKDLIAKGALSAAQLEPIVYAGHAHSQMLPAAEGETAYRRGLMIGDGTGVGKGREVAGIILDNWLQGRRKALWISEKKPLIEDARRDWKGLDRDPKQIFDLGKVKSGIDMRATDGIGFLTYDTLKGGERLGKDDKGKAKLGKTRLDQIVNWLGPDFDGVIAFDEAHAMANSLQTKGSRGLTEPSQKAIAGLELQRRLPNARVVYVSATGATEVSNLAYAERLGLWGRGTAFPKKTDFVSQVEGGGVAAMELVARDMKAMGSYAARSLSYDGVEYDRLEHPLTPEQKEIYDSLAEAWQVTLNNFQKALEATGGNKDRKARGSAASAFWGAHQRFFNQIITAMQMPTVLRGVERDLAEKRQAVLQLVNTNEASQGRALAKIEEEADLEDLDMTPRDQLMQLVEHSFPVAQHETFIDEHGNERTRVVKDSQGRVVENKKAVAMREALLDELGSIRVPDGPLEMLINHFGTDGVAEVTGRKQRVVRKPDDKGQIRTQIETRPGSANITEADAFQGGKKPILVFSQAGGTGRSYHADNSAPSADARRSHYLVQAGWRADAAIQGFGRTHRTNQASAPIYHLVTTDLEGQRRFISSIARRLAQLGALTRGERRAGEQGMFSARDNLESREASEALYTFFRDLYFDRVPEIGIDEFERQTGLRLRDDNGNLLRNLPPITQFLNRLLSLKYDLQNTVFHAFEQRLGDAVDRAAATGTLDVGTETLRADRITKAEERSVHTDLQSGAETRYVRFAIENRNSPLTFDQVSAGSRLTGGRPPEFFVQSKRSGKVYAVVEAHAATDTRTGQVIDNYRLVDPLQYQFAPQSRIDYGQQYWDRIDDQAKARALWDQQVAQVPEYRRSDLHMITGAILPIWDRLAGTPKVYRLQTEAGELFLGRDIPEADVDRVLKALGADAASRQYAPEDVVERIMQGDRARLANDWTIKRSLVASEPRLELVGADYRHRTELEKDGVFVERIGSQTRFFIPTGDRGAEVLSRVIAHRPIAEMSGTGELESPRGWGSAETGNEATRQPSYRDQTAEYQAFLDQRGGTDPHGGARDWVLGQARDSGNEHLAAHDIAGGSHASTIGMPDRVNLGGDLLSLASDPSAGIVIHHNHPSGRALSNTDIAALGYPGIRHVLAHGGNDIFGASLTQEAREAALRLHPAHARAGLSRAYGAAYAVVTPALRMQALGNKISTEEVHRIHADLINRALDAAGIIDYVGTRQPQELAPKVRDSIVSRAAEAASVTAEKHLGFRQRDQGIDDRLYRSTLAISPDQAMAGLPRVPGAGAAKWSGVRPEAHGAIGVEGQGRGQEALVGGGRGGEPPGLAAPPPIPPGGPPPDKLAADLRGVMATDERPFMQRAREWLANARQDAWLKFRMGWQDRLSGMERDENRAKAAGVEVTPATSPLYAARLAKNSANVAQTALRYTQVRYNSSTGTVEPIEGSKSYIDILKPLAAQGRYAMDSFAAWTIARRAERLTSEGRERNVGQDFIAEYKNLDKAQSDGGTMFHAVDHELQGWYDHLLDFAEQTGMLSGETRKLFGKGDYVPFFRSLDDETITGPKSGAGRILRSPIRELMGGEARINNIFENGVIAASAVIRKGMQNIVRQRVADTLDKVGAVTPLGKAERARLEAEVSDPAMDANLRTAGIDPDELTADAKAGTRGLWMALKNRDDDVLGFMRDGKPAYFRVNDPFLYRGLSTLGPGRFDGIVSILAQPARLLRAAVILDPSFMLRHNIRMVEQAYMAEGINPIAGISAALRQTRGLDPAALKLMASGAVSGRYDVDLPQQIRREIMSPTYQSTLIDTPLKALKLIGHLSESAMRASDLGPRIAVYEKAIRDGASEAEALDRARDVLDFSTKGDSEIANFFAQTIPFLNARWQGIARSGRALLGPTRNAVLLRGMLVTAATMALWNQNKDRPEWQQLPDWDRQYATHFWVDGIHYRIPRNWELGALFQTIPEIIMQYVHNGNAREAQNATVAMIDNVFKVNPVTFIPAGLRPMLDAYYNTDSYTGAPIVNEAEARKLVDDRYAPGTSPAVVAVTHAYNAASPHPIAPATMEFLMRGYLAGWGAYIAAAADWIGENAGLEVPRPTPRVTDYPIVGAVARVTPEASNRIQTDFYQMRSQIAEVGNSLKAAEKAGDAESIRHLLTAHPEFSPGLERALNHVGEVLSKQRQALNLRLESAKLSADDKRQAEDNFWRWRDNYMRGVAPLLRRAEGITP